MQKLFQKKGVPHHHEMHIPEDEEKIPMSAMF